MISTNQSTVSLLIWTNERSPLCLNCLQVEAGDGEVRGETGVPAGEGFTHRTKLSEERSTLEVGRVGILNKTEVTNTQWLQTGPFEVRDSQFC